MPWISKKKANARRRAGRKNAAGLATRPKMMGKTLAIKRKHGVDTRVFWFKQNDILTTTPSNGQFKQWRTNDISSPGSPASFYTLASLFDQYKLLGMKVRLFPANLGTEPNPAGSGGVGAPRPLLRGNVAVWIDQRLDGLSNPSTIDEVIGNNNCRLINANRPYSMSLWRPKGQSLWGSCKTMSTDPDPWVAGIKMLVNDASVSPSTGSVLLWFYTVQYKVVYRGRQND